MTRKTYCGNLLWQSGLTLLALIDYPEWNKNAIDFNVEVHNE